MLDWNCIFMINCPLARDSEREKEKGKNARLKQRAESAESGERAESEWRAESWELTKWARERREIETERLKRLRTGETICRLVGYVCIYIMFICIQSKLALRSPVPLLLAIRCWWWWCDRRNAAYDFWGMTTRVGYAHENINSLRLYLVKTFYRFSPIH